LSNDTTDKDVRELASAIGPVSRTFMAKNIHTGKSKGYAFVTFMDTATVEKAIRKLDGYGYDNLILKVEYATKPK
jgi:translation initiation factor 3 subunit G